MAQAFNNQSPIESKYWWKWLCIFKCKYILYYIYLYKIIRIKFLHGIYSRHFSLNFSLISPWKRYLKRYSSDPSFDKFFQYGCYCFPDGTNQVLGGYGEARDGADLVTFNFIKTNIFFNFLLSVIVKPLPVLMKILDLQKIP